MAIYYADASVLVKRHVPEVGTLWVVALVALSSGNTIFTAQLSLVEMFSALNRRVREKSLDAQDYANIRVAVNHSWSMEYGIIPFTSSIAAEAIGLLERHPLRAYDAVQLASALQATIALQQSGSPVPIFLSADDHLLDAAKAEGLPTDNPNLYT